MTNPYRAMAKKFNAPYEPGITKLAVLNRRLDVQGRVVHHPSLGRSS